MQAIRGRKTDIEDLTSLISREHHIYQTADIQRLQTILQETKLPLHRIQHHSERTLEILMDIHQQNVLDWTSLIPYQKYYAQARKKILKDTGK